MDRIEWLGVKGTEWSRSAGLVPPPSRSPVRLEADNLSRPTASLNINYDLLIPLTSRDEKKVRRLLLDFDPSCRASCGS